MISSKTSDAELGPGDRIGPRPDLCSSARPGKGGTESLALAREFGDTCGRPDN
jgi:hypothetical protein